MITPDFATTLSAERVLVPSGRDYGPCVDAFQAAFNIEVPTFEDRQLVASSGGREFTKVKGKDVPMLVAAGLGDIGLTGTDVCAEHIDSTKTNVGYVAIGETMCTFDILAPEDDSSIVGKLDGDGKPVIVATGLPRLLDKTIIDRKLNAVQARLTMSGSVEAAVSLGLADVVADVFQTGMTAKTNGLRSVMTLADIKPALVFQDPSKKYVPTLSREGILGIDRTLTLRSAQIDDPSVTSYSLDRLRDPNKAGKKFGEETAEVMMALFGDGSIEDCEGEIADLVYSALIAGRSQNKQVLLENVIRTLVGRNQATLEQRQP